MRRPVLMIGLDAAEATLIDRLCEEGRLPALRALMQRGCQGRLGCEASLFAGGVWPTFYTSKSVPWHGIYHHIEWRPDRMRFELIAEDWLPERPFWERLERSAYRVAIVDVPLVVGTPRATNGIQLAGWGTHDPLVAASWPEDLWVRLKRRYGPPPMHRAPLDATPTVDRLLQLRDLLLKTTEQMAAISQQMLTSDAWDLFFVVFGATHRGGHYLWDRSQLEAAGVPVTRSDELDDALASVYAACDAAVARLIDSAPAEARILVFAVHGMEPNAAWNHIVEDLLGRMQAGERHRPQRDRPSPVQYLRRIAPQSIVRPILERLPLRLRTHIDMMVKNGLLDWSNTRYFALDMDLSGYLRINLRGRESRGLVPAKEYQAERDSLEEALLDFRDIDTDEPLIGEIHHVEDIAPADAPYRHLLPDLVVTGPTERAVASRGVRSKRFGEVLWGERRMIPSGRSGNHTDHGWFVAAGEGIPAGARARDCHIRDLAPTVLRWLGTTPPPDFMGRPIVELVAPDAP
jgi:predicted AlkP superfamily phosphohydrolase/phosphomutase